MKALLRLFGWLGPRREAAGQPLAPPPDAPAAAAPAGPMLPSGELAEALLSEGASDHAGLVPALLAVGFGDAAGWARRLAQPMRRRAIWPGRRRAAFLATIAHESNGGRALEEALGYSAHRIVAVWPRRFRTLEAAEPFARRPEALANEVYAGRIGNGPPESGDGWRFRGRGLIGLTGRSNYGAAADALGLPLVTRPDLAADAAVAARVAAWWWTAHGCNELADAGDVPAWRRRVNGGLTGLDDVRRRYEDALRVA